MADLLHAWVLVGKLKSLLGFLLVVISQTLALPVELGVEQDTAPELLPESQPKDTIYQAVLDKAHLRPHTRAAPPFHGTGPTLLRIHHVCAEFSRTSPDRDVG